MNVSKSFRQEIVMGTPFERCFVQPSNYYLMTYDLGGGTTTL